MNENVPIHRSDSQTHTETHQSVSWVPTLRACCLVFPGKSLRTDAAGPEAEGTARSKVPGGLNERPTERHEGGHKSFYLNRNTDDHLRLQIG